MCPRWSWVVSIHRLARFRRALSPLSYTTLGPAPGLEPRSPGEQPSAHPVGPGRHGPGRRDHAASSGGVPSSASTRRSRAPCRGMDGVSGTSVVPTAAVGALSSGTTSLSRLCRMECTSFRWFGRKVSNPHLKDQSLASCHWTTPEWVNVRRVNGYRPHYSWVEATRVSVNTLTPWSRRIPNLRPSRRQRVNLLPSYFCDGGTGWILTSVARVATGYSILGHGARAAEEGIEPPTTVVNGHQLSGLNPVWLNGLEPPTPRSRTGCSVQTELQPGECRMTPAGCASRGSTPDDMDEESIALPTGREAHGAGGEGRTLTGVCPPDSESGASSISATPAWWTQPGSNRHASRCKRGALPLVLWAHGPGGSNRTTAGTMPRGLQPRSSSQQRSPGQDRSVWPRQ